MPPFRVPQGPTRSLKDLSTDDVVAVVCATEKSILYHSSMFIVRSRGGKVCRPTCPSMPKRRSSLTRTPQWKMKYFKVFESFEQAKSKGHIPCQRCRPDDKEMDESIPTKIERICRFLERSPRKPTGKELARRVGICEEYFARVFKKLTGVTPARYHLRYCKFNADPTSSDLAAVPSPTHPHALHASQPPHALQLPQSTQPPPATRPAHQSQAPSNRRFSDHLLDALGELQVASPTFSLNNINSLGSPAYSMSGSPPYNPPSPRTLSGSPTFAGPALHPGSPAASFRSPTTASLRSPTTGFANLSCDLTPAGVGSESAAPNPSLFHSDDHAYYWPSNPCVSDEYAPREPAVFTPWDTALPPPAGSLNEDLVFAYSYPAYVDKLEFSCDQDAYQRIF